MDTLINRLTGLLRTGLALVILLMVTLACVNVALRYLWGISLLWADEALVFAMVGVTFLGVISVSARSNHLRMTLFVQALGPRGKRVLEALEHVVTITICLFVAYYSWKVVAMLIKRGTLSNMADVPLWTLHLLVLTGLAGMALIAALQLFTLVRHSRKDAS